MRKIKFRGKTVKGGRWIYGDLLRTNESTGDGYAIQYYDETDGWMVEDVRESTIGQYTGLRDRRGNEIYEGDIVGTQWGEVAWGVVNWEAWGIVTWHNHGYFFIDTTFGRWKYCVNDFFPLGDTINKITIKIIGNVHDNPELINE